MAEDEKNIVAVVAARLDSLHSDMQEMRAVQSKVADALIDLARLGEKQQYTADSLKRALTSMERLDQRVVGLDRRVDMLEKDAPMQKQTSNWVISAVWAAAGLAVMFVGKKLGLI